MCCAQTPALASIFYSQQIAEIDSRWGQAILANADTWNAGKRHVWCSDGHPYSTHSTRSTSVHRSKDERHMKQTSAVRISYEFRSSTFTHNPLYGFIHRLSLTSTTRQSCHSLTSLASLTVTHTSYTFCKLHMNDESISVRMMTTGWIWTKILCFAVNFLRRSHHSDVHSWTFDLE